ncbi:hypothetical protein [Mycolicibacterium fluoranthenivorans]|uniref:Uncharacterized protein n=1 Tax=Mycolicibacterium fluoranthenivorans TaxID=258505 RepID=A0A7X5U5V2_9MYCO|nr:hypothetical protein [Mycolicibacterium fluoranthenivorans]MCV7354483.1 hypothetical protein [Mycolicibacterium fluoranthenivorans]NIH98914.1 hypothetical protein [Mycolicibacterium fluoranthenivorans]
MDKAIGITAIVLLGAIVYAFRRQTATPQPVTLTEETITQIKEIAMSATQDAVDAIAAQLTRAKDEISSEITKLEEQVAQGQAPDLTALKAAAQALDDVVPDAPVEQPVEPVEPPVSDEPVDAPAETTE